MRAWYLVAVLAAVALATPGCGDKPKEAAPSPPSATPTPAPSIGSRVMVAGVTANYHGTEEIAGAKTATIELSDSYFSPTVLHGTPGQKIVVTLKNNSKSPHHFSTADQQFMVEIQPGLTAEGRITLPQDGNLSFYCLMDKEDGMAGAFNVSGPLDEKGPASVRPS